MIVLCCGCAGSTSPFRCSRHLPYVDTSHMLYTLSVDHHLLWGSPPCLGLGPSQCEKIWASSSQENSVVLLYWCLSWWTAGFGGLMTGSTRSAMSSIFRWYVETFPFIPEFVLTVTMSLLLSVLDTISPHMLLGSILQQGSSLAVSVLSVPLVCHLSTYCLEEQGLEFLIFSTVFRSWCILLLFHYPPTSISPFTPPKSPVSKCVCNEALLGPGGAC